MLITKEITPEQQSLLDGPNSHQYPAGRKLSKDKGNTWSSELQETMLEYINTAKEGTDSGILHRPNQTYDGITDVKLQQFFREPNLSSPHRSYW